MYEPMLKPKEVAYYLGINTTKVISLYLAGLLRGYCFGQRSYRFYDSDVRLFKKNNERLLKNET